MTFNGSKLYEFGPYRLDQQKRQLWREGQSVPLTAKAMEILLVLVGRADQIVSRHELIETVWPDAYVEEANLTQNVFLLRKALGETAQNHNYIVTVPGKGYRFAAEVQVHEVGNGNGRPTPMPEEALPPSSSAVVGNHQQEMVFGNLALQASPALAAASAPQAAAAASTQQPVRRMERMRFWIAAAILLVIALAGYLSWQSLQQRNQPASRRKVIAVLPFVNLTGDRAQDYLSDGLTEEMTLQLGRLDPRRLGVIARTSVMRYKNRPEQLQRIGRELGVDYVLEGSVRRDSDKVRIAAQLIQMKDQTHVWAGEYDRELTSLLVLQNTIAQEIAKQIELTLGEPQRTSLERQLPLSPQKYEAYDLYLQGRYFWNKRTVQGFRQAIECFQRAIVKDPSYARAYAGLADSYVLMSAYSLNPSGEFIPKARAAAQHALALDESLAEAHASLALISQNYDWNWQVAEKEYRRAIELDPNYATAHHWYAEHLALQGRFDEAFPEIERARQLDPLSLIIATDHGVFFYFARQYDRAVQQFRTVLAMEPNFPRAHMLGTAYLQQGRHADALADATEWRRAGKDSPWPLAQLTYIYSRSGQQAKANQEFRELQRLYRRRNLDPAPMFIAYIGLGNQDQALAWLQKAYLQHSSALTALKVDPIYDPLRRDPRFQDLLRRVGLAP